MSELAAYKEQKEKDDIVDPNTDQSDTNFIDAIESACDYVVQHIQDLSKNIEAGFDNTEL